MKRPVLPAGTDVAAAAATVLRTYNAFIARAPGPEELADPKAFAAWHAAARAALSHLEQLLEMAPAKAESESQQLLLDRIRTELRGRIPPATAAEEKEARYGDGADT